MNNFKGAVAVLMTSTHLNSAQNLVTDHHNFKSAKRSQFASMLVPGTYDVVDSDRHEKRFILDVAFDP